MVNQKDPSSKTKEVISLETIEESKDISDAAKKATLKETAWQRIFICTIRRKQMKTSI